MKWQNVKYTKQASKATTIVHLYSAPSLTAFTNATLFLHFMTADTIERFVVAEEVARNCIQASVMEFPSKLEIVLYFGRDGTKLQSPFLI